MTRFNWTSKDCRNSGCQITGKCANPYAQNIVKQFNLSGIVITLVEPHYPDNPVLGCTIYPAQGVMIRIQNLPSSADIVLHELIHALLHRNGLTRESDDEDLVRQLSRTLRFSRLLVLFNLLMSSIGDEESDYIDIAYTDLSVADNGSVDTLVVDHEPFIIISKS